MHSEVAGIHFKTPHLRVQVGSGLDRSARRQAPALRRRAGPLPGGEGCGGPARGGGQHGRWSRPTHAAPQLAGQGWPPLPPSMVAPNGRPQSTPLAPHPHTCARPPPLTPASCPCPGPPLSPHGCPGDIPPQGLVGRRCCPWFQQEVLCGVCAPERRGQRLRPAGPGRCGKKDARAQAASTSPRPTVGHTSLIDRPHLPSRSLTS